MNKIYITNNNVESINSKINYYLPKNITSNINFVQFLTNLIANNKLNNNEYKKKIILQGQQFKLLKNLN